MKQMCVAVAILAAAACAPGAPQTPKAGSAMPASIVDPLVRIHDALAADSIDQVKQNAGEVATAASALGAPAMKIDTAAVQLAAAPDLNTARDRYGALSDAVVAYAKGLNLTMPEGVRTAFCPMVQRHWLQKGDTITNPYFGTGMPTCGEFR
jgi:hypothetical protein